MESAHEPAEKNLSLERMVFFCDAVVAIAITLLALDLRVEHTAGARLQFSDILAHWKTFAAFFLSFFNIATFWSSYKPRDCVAVKANGGEVRFSMTPTEPAPSASNCRADTAGWSST